MTSAIRAGALAGLAGGATSAVFLGLVGERSLGAAIALEQAGAGAHAPEAMYGRSTQQVGGMVGTTLVGMGLGVLLAVVFMRLRPRLPGRTDWLKALWLGGAAWVTLHLVPALKYPPNPPGVGDPDTVGTRTSTYLLLMAFSVVAAVAASTFSAWVGRRGADEQLRVVAGAVGYAALVAIALLAFPPTPDAVDAPAQLVWRFRLQSLGGTALLWLASAMVLGRLVTPRVKAPASSGPARSTVS